MHNTDGYPALGSLVVEKGRWSTRTLSKGGSAIPTDDLQCPQYPRSEMEDGDLEGPREAHTPQGKTWSLDSILQGGPGNEVQCLPVTSLQHGRAAQPSPLHCHRESNEMEDRWSTADMVWHVGEEHGQKGFLEHLLERWTGTQYGCRVKIEAINVGTVLWSFCAKTKQHTLNPLHFSLTKPSVPFPCFTLPERLWKAFKRCLRLDFE